MIEKRFQQMNIEAAKEDAQLIVEILSGSEKCCENIVGNLDTYQFTRLSERTRGFTTAKELPHQVWGKLPVEYIYGGNNSEFMDLQ